MLVRLYVRSLIIFILVKDIEELDILSLENEIIVKK